MGPGSYTGLRIGVSTAKGLCYGLDIPLISVSTLKAMSSAMILKQQADLYCPMIDARRMEVYSAIFDANNNQLRDILQTSTQTPSKKHSNFNEKWRSLRDSNP